MLKRFCQRDEEDTWKAITMWDSLIAIWSFSSSQFHTKKGLTDHILPKYLNYNIVTWTCEAVGIDWVIFGVSIPENIDHQGRRPHPLKVIRSVESQPFLLPLIRKGKIVTQALENAVVNVWTVYFYSAHSVLNPVLKQILGIEAQWSYTVYVLKRLTISLIYKQLKRDFIFVLSICSSLNTPHCFNTTTMFIIIMACM